MKKLPFFPHPSLVTIRHNNGMTDYGWVEGGTFMSSAFLKGDYAGESVIAKKLCYYDLEHECSYTVTQGWNSAKNCLKVNPMTEAEFDSLPYEWQLKLLNKSFKMR